MAVAPRNPGYHSEREDPILPWPLPTSLTASPGNSITRLRPALDPGRCYELLDGTIYAMSPAKPPHAGVVTFFNHRFRTLDAAKYLVRVQDTLEIEPDGAPEPDLAVVAFRDDFYGGRHPNGAEAALVVEVGDTQRKTRDKMSDYMRDGRTPFAWRIDLPNPCVELWEPRTVGEPVAVVFGAQSFTFGSVVFTVDEVFSTVLKR